MSWILDYQAEWDGATSFRCVAVEHLDVDLKKKSLLDILLSAGLSAERGLSFLRKHSYLKSTNDEMIQRNVDYVFSRRKRYIANRFNDHTFPALYTSYEIETAVAERSKYVEDRDRPFHYGVFEVTLHGDAADLRDAIRAGVWDFPDDHLACQMVGKEVRDEGFDGLVAPSKVCAGTNSAVFEKDAAQGRSIAKIGEVM